MDRSRVPVWICGCMTSVALCPFVYVEASRWTDLYIKYVQEFFHKVNYELE
jgi:hypothetical protein